MVPQIKLVVLADLDINCQEILLYFEYFTVSGLELGWVAKFYYLNDFTTIIVLASTADWGAPGVQHHRYDQSKVFRQLCDSFMSIFHCINDVIPFYMLPTKI
jgi:hypothetical protein